MAKSIYKVLEHHRLVVFVLHLGMYMGAFRARGEEGRICRGELMAHVDHCIAGLTKCVEHLLRLVGRRFHTG